MVGLAGKICKKGLQRVNMRGEHMHLWLSKRHQHILPRPWGPWRSHSLPVSRGLLPSSITRSSIQSVLRTEYAASYQFQCRISCTMGLHMYVSAELWSDQSSSFPPYMGFALLIPTLPLTCMYTSSYSCSSYSYLYTNSRSDVKY